MLPFRGTWYASRLLHLMQRPNERAIQARTMVIRWSDRDLSPYLNIVYASACFPCISTSLPFVFTSVGFWLTVVQLSYAMKTSSRVPLSRVCFWPIDCCILCYNVCPRVARNTHILHIKSLSLPACVKIWATPFVFVYNHVWQLPKGTASELMCCGRGLLTSSSTLGWSVLGGRLTIAPYPLPLPFDSNCTWSTCRKTPAGFIISQRAMVSSRILLLSFSSITWFANAGGMTTMELAKLWSLLIMYHLCSYL
jgi:hypothetical protein